MRSLLLFSIFLFLTGCSTTTYNKEISSGKIQNPEIIITGVNDFFTLQGEFESPFQSSTRYNSLEMGDKDLIKGYKNALHHGAKHVKVKVPSLEKELYGVLALDRADQDGVGPGTQSYKIIIPQPYIQAAKEGKISVIYEYYKLKNDGFLDVSNIKERSWILWLSDKDVFQ
ncbi:MAG: hypothetical protein COA44_07375 [Arcobacter sp.]|nr:MAG: hypothetical protein COA44_07375 [Arcobacter sp.]